MPPTFSIASWNVHCGIDAWGRPFDVGLLGAALRADIVLVQESWRPAHGRSSAELIAAAMHATVVESGLATGRRGLPHPDAVDAWQQPGVPFRSDHSLYLDSSITLPKRVATSDRYLAGEHGTWGIAIVTRLPIVAEHVMSLGRLARDPAERKLLAVDVVVDGETLTVATTHISHLTHGSHRQFRRLRHGLRQLGAPGLPMVVGGDMNCWGPLVGLQMPRWRRAVRGRTWPAWQPHSQLDHLLVSPSIAVRHGMVIDQRASDHRPLRAELSFA